MLDMKDRPAARLERGQHPVFEKAHGLSGSGAEARVIIRLMAGLCSADSTGGGLQVKSHVHPIDCPHPESQPGFWSLPRRVLRLKPEEPWDCRCKQATGNIRRRNRPGRRYAPGASAPRST